MIHRLIHSFDVSLSAHNNYELKFNNCFLFSDLKRFLKSLETSGQHSRAAAIAVFCLVTMFYLIQKKFVLKSNSFNRDRQFKKFRLPGRLREGICEISVLIER